MQGEYRILIAWAVLAVLLTAGMLGIASTTEADISVGEAIIGGMVGGVILLWVFLSKKK